MSKRARLLQEIAAYLMVQARQYDLESVSRKILMRAAADIAQGRFHPPLQSVAEVGPGADSHRLRAPGR